MLGTVIRAIQAQRTAMCHRWAVLLRACPHRSPLANPEILSYKIPETCGEVVDRLHFYLPSKDFEVKEPICPCGLNPMLDFFAMGEKAMTEGIMRALLSVPDLSMSDESGALITLHQVLQQLRVHEIDLLCSICQLQSVGKAEPRCHFPTPVRSR